MKIQLMRYKLTTLPKETAKLPILEVPNAQLTFNGAGQVQTIFHQIQEMVLDKSFTFVLQNSDFSKHNTRKVVLWEVVVEEQLHQYF